MIKLGFLFFFFFSSRRRHTISDRDWSSDVCSSDLVGDVEADGGLTPVLRDRVVLNLGAEVAATGSVPPGALDRASQVVRRFRDLVDRVEVDEVIPVATAAFREAANRPELASTIEAAIGTPLRILSGDLEA